MILAAGLTPAWQQTLVFSSFQPGAVNRAKSVHWCASGKVLNVGAALQQMGADSETLSICGGETGRMMRDNFQSLGASATWLESRTPTRVCSTILDESSGTMTELVEPAQPLSASELRQFVSQFSQQARRADWVILTGSLPRQTPTDFYRQLMQTGPANFILDVRGAELKACLALKPYLVKPNREELALSLSRPIQTDAELLAAMEELRQLGAQRVLISQGTEELWYLNARGLMRFRPPRVATVNPIGCGDCLAAGFTLAMRAGQSEFEAVQFGMAAAAENACQLLPARLDPKRVAERVSSVEMVGTSPSA